MKKQKQKFIFDVYEKTYTDIYGEQTKLLCKDIIRFGVSFEQVISQYRYSNNLYDHDENNGSIYVKYMFIHKVVSVISYSEKQKLKEGLNDMSFVKDGIEYPTEDEAFES